MQCWNEMSRRKNKFHWNIVCNNMSCTYNINIKCFIGNLFKVYLLKDILVLPTKINSMWFFLFKYVYNIEHTLHFKLFPA